MLEDILRHLNNWFVVPGGVHHGVYTVDGEATFDTLYDENGEEIPTAKEF